MSVSLRHIALVVPDLKAAEANYQPLFEMQLIGREAQLGDGLWYTLPFDKNWEDAEAAGIESGMLALRSGAFVLALFQGEAPLGLDGAFSGSQSIWSGRAYRASVLSCRP